MLQPAIKYESELKECFRDIMFDERFMYADSASYRDEYEAKTSTWRNHEFAIVHEDKVLGYIAYEIDRASNVCCGLQVINFTGEPDFIFAKDLKQALCDIFIKFGFSKLRFTCMVGNPILPHYDKICEKYGGRIVGVWEQEERLIDGKTYDLKLYEILKENFRR